MHVKVKIVSYNSQTSKNYCVVTINGVAIAAEIRYYELAMLAASGVIIVNMQEAQ
jgi:hypothetical protein